MGRKKKYREEKQVCSARSAVKQNSLGDTQFALNGDKLCPLWAARVRLFIFFAGLTMNQAFKKGASEIYKKILVGFSKFVIIYSDGSVNMAHIRAFSREKQPDKLFFPGTIIHKGASYGISSYLCSREQKSTERELASFQPP